MEVSALTYSGASGLQARSPLLRLQSDERLISLVRRGNGAAFEVLVSRYHARLLGFCRHLVNSREDAEDVLQEVLAAAFNAIQADDRPIHARPWLYRIARNRCLNHLRRVQPIGVDSMDVHFSDHGASTADKVYAREHFRLLVDDIQRLPETQRSALVLREMDALSYDQIAEAMETTVASVKSLLVRARISLAEAAEARQLGCPQVRIELAEVAEGLSRRPSPLVRRHLRDCGRCSTFDRQLKHTKKGLAAVLPLGGFGLVRKLVLLHLGHSAGTGSGATGTAGVSSSLGGATASGAGGVSAGTAGGVTAGAAGGMTAGTASGVTAASGVGGLTAGATGATGLSATAIGGTAGAGGSLLSAGAGVIATKAAAGLAAAALVTAGAIDVTHGQHHRTPARTPVSSAAVKKTSSTKTAQSTHTKIVAVKPAAPTATTTATTAASPTSTTTATTATTPTTPSTTGPSGTTSTTQTSTTSSDAVTGTQTGESSPSTGSTNPGAASDPGSGSSTGATGDTGAQGTGTTGGTGATGGTGTTGGTGSTGSNSGGASASGSGSGSTSSTGSGTTSSSGSR